MIIGREYLVKIVFDKVAYEIIINDLSIINSNYPDSQEFDAAFNLRMHMHGKNIIFK